MGTGTAVYVSNIKWTVMKHQVKIMLPWDQQGKNGPKKPQPDHILVTEPKDEPAPLEPTSDVRSLAPVPAAAPTPAPVAV